MSDDIRLNHLRAYSPSAIEEGQDYWVLGLADVIGVLAAEVTNSPVVRALNPSTGEIIQGPFLVLASHLMRWIDDKQAFKVELVVEEPK